MYRVRLIFERREFGVDFFLEKFRTLGYFQSGPFPFVSYLRSNEGAENDTEYINDPWAIILELSTTRPRFIPAVWMNLDQFLENSIRRVNISFRYVSNECKIFEFSHILIPMFSTLITDKWFPTI